MTPTDTQVGDQWGELKRLAFAYRDADTPDEMDAAYDDLRRYVMEDVGLAPTVLELIAAARSVGIGPLADEPKQNPHPIRGEGELPPISLDGPHLPNEWRVWMARQLLDSKLTDKEAYGCVIWHPEISDIWKAHPPTSYEGEGLREAVEIVHRWYDSVADECVSVAGRMTVASERDLILQALQTAGRE